MTWGVITDDFATAFALVRRRKGSWDFELKDGLVVSKMDEDLKIGDEVLGASEDPYLTDVVPDLAALKGDAAWLILRRPSEEPRDLQTALSDLAWSGFPRSHRPVIYRGAALGMEFLSTHIQQFADRLTDEWRFHQYSVSSTVRNAIAIVTRRSELKNEEPHDEDLGVGDDGWTKRGPRSELRGGN